MFTFAIILLTFLFPFEFASFSTYGWFVKDSDAFDYINKYKTFSKNPFCGDIISPSAEGKEFNESIKILSDNRYISKTKLALLSRYHIKDMGRVAIWSEAHKKIKELYKQSKVHNDDFKFN